MKRRQTFLHKLKGAARSLGFTLLALLALLANPLPVIAQGNDAGSDYPSVMQHHPYYDTSCMEGVNAAPGSGAPTGLVFPNLDPKRMADAIERYIKEKYNGSPFAGTGAVLVASANLSNINPFLIIGLAQKESTLGK